MGIFDSLNKPGTSSRPGFLAAGTYDCTILGVRSQPSNDPQRPRGTHAVIVDLQVATSTNPSIRPGEPRSWIAMIEPNDKGDRALADVKCFLFAALGCDPQDANQVQAFEQRIVSQGSTVAALFDQMTGAGNPLAGKAIRVQCVERPTRGGGRFTAHTWTPAAPAAGV